MRIYALSIRNRFAAFLLVVGVVAAGVAIVAIGALLLAVLVAAGAVLALGAALYYRLRGRKGAPANLTRRRAAGLDPADEVFVEQKKQIPDRS